MHKYKNIKQNKRANLPISKISMFSNYTISIDTKSPLNPASDRNQYTYVNIQLFSSLTVTLPTSKNAHYAINSFIHYWVSKLGPPRDLITDRGTEYLNTEMANRCTRFIIRHSPRTP